MGWFWMGSPETRVIQGRSGEVAKVGKKQQEGLVELLSSRGRAEVEALPPRVTGPRITGRGTGGASDPRTGVQGFLP